MRVYVLTRLVPTDSVPVSAAYSNARDAMLAHNRWYFGDDFGTTFNELEGWEPYDAEKHARQGGDSPPNGASVMVFNDEGDLVFVVGLEIQGQTEG